MDVGHVGHAYASLVHTYEGTYVLGSAIRPTCKGSRETPRGIVTAAAWPLRQPKAFEELRLRSGPGYTIATVLGSHGQVNGSRLSPPKQDVRFTERLQRWRRRLPMRCVLSLWARLREEH